MSVLCLNVCRLCLSNIMSLGVCFVKKIALVLVRLLDTASKFVLFSVSGLKDKQLIKKQTCTKTETCKLCSRVFWIFLPNFIKIDHYNFEIYRFKVCAFFLRHSVYFLSPASWRHIFHCRCLSCTFAQLYLVICMFSAVTLHNIRLSI